MEGMEGMEHIPMLSNLLVPLFFLNHCHSLSDTAEQTRILTRIRIAALALHIRHAVSSSTKLVLRRNSSESPSIIEQVECPKLWHNQNRPSWQLDVTPWIGMPLIQVDRLHGEIIALTQPPQFKPRVRSIQIRAKSDELARAHHHFNQHRSELSQGDPSSISEIERFWLLFDLLQIKTNVPVQMHDWRWKRYLQPQRCQHQWACQACLQRSFEQVSKRRESHLRQNVSQLALDTNGSQAALHPLPKGDRLMWLTRKNVHHIFWHHGTRQILCRTTQPNGKYWK